MLLDKGNNSGPCRTSHETPEWDTIPCIGIERPANVLAFRSKCLGTSLAPGIRTRRDGNASCSIEKLGQPRPMGFKILDEGINFWDEFFVDFSKFTLWAKNLQELLMIVVKANVLLDRVA